MKTQTAESLAILAGVACLLFVAYEVYTSFDPAAPGNSTNPRNPIATTGSIVGDISQMISNFWNTPPWTGNPFTGQAYGATAPSEVSNTGAAYGVTQ